MTFHQLPPDAECLIPGCGSPLYLIRSLCIPVDDSFGAATDDRHAISEWWEIVCEQNDHRLDSGGSETDGRSALIGYRSAQSLGGLR